MTHDPISAAEAVAAVAREHATRVDAEAAFPEATIAAARRAGLLALTCATEVGGHGKGLAEEFHWQGTRDFSNWLTIPAALRFMESAGWDAVRRHNHALALWAHWFIEANLPAQPACPADHS